MKFTIYQRLVIIFLLTVFFAASFPGQGFGGEHHVFTRLTVEEGYDSNIFWNTRNPETDWMFTFSPHLTWENSFPLNSLRAEAGMAFIKHKKHDELNTQREQYQLMWDTRLTPLLSGNLSGSYLKDTTFESELEETGVVYSHTDRKRYSGGPQITWLLSERSQLSFSYQYSEVSYDKSGYVGYQTHDGSILVSQYLHDGRATLSWNNGYSRYDYNNQYNQSTDNFHSLLGLDYRLRELSKISISSGIIYSETQAAKNTILSESMHKKERSGFGGISFLYQHSKGNVSIVYSKDISPSGSYGTITREKVSLSADYSFLKTTTGTFRWVRIISKSEDYLSGFQQKHKNDHFVYSISLTHRLRKYIFLDLTYSPQISKKITSSSLSETSEEGRRDTIFLKLRIDNNYKIQ
ncbi:MAG: hypothetical protein AB1847_10840 [bacterium]